MDLMELLLNRRSIRKYTGERIPEKDLEKILQAGLASASGRNRKPWELVVVQDREMLEKLSHCRTGAAKMLEKAGCAILVFADMAKTDVWTEDCSIVMSNMHLMAASLGLGSCWIQGRLREAENGQTTLDIAPSGTGDLRVGDTVYAIGNPLGLGLAVSSGIVSATQRVAERYTLPCVMSTADISEGSSGGALLNVYGQVVAVTSGAYVYGNSMYLAVPIDPVLTADLTGQGQTLAEVKAAEAA